MNQCVARTLRRELLCYTARPLMVRYEWLNTQVYLVTTTRVEYGPTWHKTALKLDELYAHKKLVIRQRSPKHA